ncbi:DUF2155 domain-containing protein [Henriciella sp.]|uniref:DUF2155 domain-containing protein n=1 Tax=Henriciella sp. TaxID=1968823 RepID=UPI00263886B6|nr:DUF2155 domain-containing protein [Henriciella sp.]
MNLSRVLWVATLLAVSAPDVAAQLETIEEADQSGEVQENEPSVLLEPGEESEEDEGRTYTEEKTATLRALDKITGRSTDFEIEVGEPVVYGALKIGLEVCFQTPPEEPPESAAFLKIVTTENIRMQSVTEPRLASELESVSDDNIDAIALADAEAGQEQANGVADNELLFSGWMFASSPGLSALEHPVYDVWVIRCTEPSPVSPSSPGNPTE